VVLNPSLLVYSTHPVFTLIVNVKDNGTDSLSASAVITINLRQDENSRIVYIDPTNINDALENGSLLHPYDSWYDFTFIDGGIYLQKRGTSFQVVNPILIDQKIKINLSAYGVGSIPILYSNRYQAKIVDLENTQNCFINDLEIKSNGSALACVYVGGTSSDDITIESCYLHNSQNGVMLVGVNGTFVVRYSTVSNNGNGINTDAAVNEFYYNQFISNTTAVKTQQNRKAIVTNNTFYGNTLHSIESLSGTIISSINNIFFLDASSTKVYKLKGITNSNYNIFNVEKTGFLNGYNTLRLWRKNTGQDKNSKVSDPKFVSVATSDFRVKNGSPCINRASNANLHRDYFGTDVPQGGIPDIGFFELIPVVVNNSITPDEVSADSSDSALLMNSAMKITAYPNPTAGIVRIKIDKEDENPVDIKVVDLFGKTIYATESNNNEVVEINLENQLTGTYFALVKVNGQTISKKLVVQR
jgi:hypothetical protein